MKGRHFRGGRYWSGVGDVASEYLPIIRVIQVNRITELFFENLINPRNIPELLSVTAR